MKLIIEKFAGKYYAYVENETHHSIVERTKQRRCYISNTLLKNECNLDLVYDADRWYMVFDLAEPVQKKAEEKPLLQQHNPALSFEVIA